MPESEFLFFWFIEKNFLYRNHRMDDLSQGTTLDSNDGFWCHQFTTLL